MNYVYKIIESMRTRPELYIGRFSMAKLQSFLIGYQMALDDLKVTENTSNALLPLPFYFFHEYVAHYFGYYASTSGWCNMILEQVAQDEVKGLSLFYVLFDNFKQIEIECFFSANLNESNFIFYLSDKSVPKRLKDEKFDIIEPLYDNPLRIYYAKLKSSAIFVGYLGIIQTSDEYIIERKIYKTEESVLAYFENCFGAIAWQKQYLGNLVFAAELHSSGVSTTNQQESQ